MGLLYAKAFPGLGGAIGGPPNKSYIRLSGSFPDPVHTQVGKTNEQIHVASKAMTIVCIYIYIYIYIYICVCVCVGFENRNCAV
jgi:hypothetical protein